MNWSERMHRVIAYFESNLDSDVDINEAARLACASKYHFHRVFYAMFGVTPADYVRKRKMTLAATELIAGNTKVIDVAAKYGYDSPNAFTRAFRSLHGINPSAIQATKGHFPEAKIRAFKRASINVNFRGADMLEYNIVERPAFLVLGKSKDFTFDEFVKQGPKFWKEYVASDDYKTLTDLTLGRAGKVSQASMMSVYFPNAEGSRDAFTELLGVEVLSDTVSDTFAIHRVPPATYAEFNCTYKTSMKTNKYIYGEWFPATGYERDNSKADIAAYFPVAFRHFREMAIRWWIPIVKNKQD